MVLKLCVKDFALGVSVQFGYAKSELRSFEKN